MKKVYLVLFALLAFGFNVKAQQYVSTAPANRNVILEEFTGRGCGYCTDGHRIANQIMAANPGRVWAINVHAGGYAYTTYPNFNTTASTTIMGGFSVSGFPSGVVNRTTSAAIDRGQWNGQATTQLNQASECNVAGIVRVNPGTRIATITVEVYYTGNSSVDENYLTVAMLQDSILGSQSDYGNYNPTQWLNGQYVHMHVLRDMVTPIWGEAIAPTTAGTLITKTYEYPIPETIGNPNGVDVVLDHIFFLAWISERQQGSATRPILTACELEKTNMTDEPIYPSMSAVTQSLGASCSLDKDFGFNVTNIGTEMLTSMRFNVEVADVVQEFEWTGELPSGETEKMGFSAEIPFGSYIGTLNIIEANGEAFEESVSFVAESLEWGEVLVEGETTDIKVYIIQDQWGEQITWDIVNSAGEVVAEGGPYQHLVGSGSTQINVANVNDLPANDCYMFTINDSNNNGICCNYGNGYYYIKDANGNKIFEGDGEFGSQARHLFSIRSTMAVESVAQESLKVYPNPANDYLMVEGEMTSVEVYNAIGQRLMTKAVDGNSTRISLSNFSNGIYFLRVSNNGEVMTRKFSVNR
jgi:hypothetical protein